MQVYVFKTEQDVDTYVGQQISTFIQDNDAPVIGFATGSTPLGAYDYLIDSYQSGKTDFSKVRAFNLDEYVGIEKDHPQSFARAMKDYLFSKINIKEENIYSLNGNAKDMTKECKEFDSESHVVDLHPESIQSSLDYGFTKIEDVPTQGVTQGIKTIMKARQLIMIAKGNKKAKLVERMLYGPVSEDFPSSIIQTHNNVIVVLDQCAAANLKEETYERR